MTTAASSSATTTTATQERWEEEKQVDVSYLSHYGVAQYLRQYERDFELTKCIVFGCTIQQLTVLSMPGNNNNNDGNDHRGILQVSPHNEKWPKIRLDWDHDDDSLLGRRRSSSSDVFDAVFICNGHYSQPLYPSIPGLVEDYFQGTKVMHSLAYDDPSKFKDQVVLCIGGRASGADLAQELSFHARHVYLSHTTCVEAVEVVPPPKTGTTTMSSSSTTAPIKWVPKMVSIQPDGSIRFDRDCNLRPKDVDSIVFCSGYDYSFPFINERSTLHLRAVPGERRVTHLYLQLVRFLLLFFGFFLGGADFTGSSNTETCFHVWSEVTVMTFALGILSSHPTDDLHQPLAFILFSIDYFLCMCVHAPSVWNHLSGMLSTPTWHLWAFPTQLFLSH